MALLNSRSKLLTAKQPRRITQPGRHVEVGRVVKVDRLETIGRKAVVKEKDFREMATLRRVMAKMLPKTAIDLRVMRYQRTSQRQHRESPLAR
jgi:hypothetical protein